MLKRIFKVLQQSVVTAIILSLGTTGYAVPVSAENGAGQPSIVRIATSGPGAKRTINLGLNKALVIDLPVDAHDILVANPEKADAVTRTSRRIYLFGKAVGQTNIFIFGANGAEIVSLDVNIERDVGTLESQLRRFIPDSNISVEIISDNIVLTGTVSTPQDASRASDLAQVFLRGGEATTRNITAQGTNGDADIYAERRQQSQIVNMLKIDGEDQVTLKITVAEVSRQVLKQLGFNTSAVGSGNQIDFVNPTNLGGSTSWAANAALNATAGNYNISTYINAMEQAGVMRTLAEPTLTAISGEEAKFYVGGQFNLVGDQSISYEDSQGNQTSRPTVDRSIRSVDYGIRLNFKPVVLGPGRISLKVATEVSEPTFEGSTVSLAGRGIPASTFLAIRKREASTSVELPSGGSIVIAGLVKDDIRQAMSGVPGLAKIPIFGTLFRSKDFVRNETEMVIIATPYLVRPVARNALSKPDDNFNPTNDAASFFLGQVNRVYGRQDKAVPGPYHGNVGFIYK